MPHIDVNRESDLLLVMPATANLIAKAARGIADDLASTLICARRTPIAFVPAMNAAMWRNPATRRNIEFLRREGALIFGPAEGLQACGDTGCGSNARTRRGRRYDGNGLFTEAPRREMRTHHSGTYLRSH